MPRRVFKPLSRQRHRWKARWFMRPFSAWIENPAYWSLNRRNVTRAFSLGLLMAFIPIPVHALAATAMALVLRLNIPAAVMGTLLANPLTIVPMFVTAYWVGCRLMNAPPDPIQFEMSWAWLQTELVPIWQPFLLGCLVTGLATALLGYVALALAWRISLVVKQRRRKPTEIRRD